MSERVVLDYLRSRSRVEPPSGFVRSVMTAIDDAPPARSWASAFLPAAAVAGVVAVVAVMALLLGQGLNVGPGPNESPESTSSAMTTTVDDLRTAVTEALEELRSHDGVEGVGTYYVFDAVGGASWFSWRPGGDQVVVNRTDLDVTESGWWLNPDAEPPARGERVETTIQVITEGSYYFTRGAVDAADGWISALQDGSPEVLGVPFPAALDGRVDPWQSDFVLTLEGTASRVTQADGGVQWTLVRTVREGSLVQRFDVGPHGELRAVFHELVGAVLTPDDRAITSSLIELTVLDDPEPIATPDVDSPPDPAVFGMPDLPLAAAQPVAGIDYREYVQVVLDYMEAYHWNSAEIDWAAARAEALDGLPADPEAKQAYQRIQNAIATFGGSGVVFVRPQDVPPTDEPAPGPMAAPESARMGDIGYVLVPTPPMSGADALREYLRAGRLAIAAVEKDAPACGWIVDLRDHAGGAWGPPIAVLGGLLGEGRALTFASGSAEWWLEIEADGLVTSAGFDDSDVLVDSAYIEASSERDQEIIDAFAAEQPYVPEVDGAPVAVLIGNGTVTGGEQTVVAFMGREGTRLFGGPTGASPIVAPNVRMTDGATLRVPTWVPIDRERGRHTASILPDESVGDTRATGTDAVLDAARTWLEQQDACS